MDARVPQASVRSLRKLGCLPAHDVERERLKLLLLQTEFLDGSCHVVKRLFDHASKLL
jgi:hypothetical protein